MPSRSEAGRRPLFVLVHGGQQGAWVFDLLIDELGGRGYAAVAVDMPAHDANAGASEYADLIAGSLSGIVDDVVLVGHSMGGLTIPLVPGRRPVRRLVFVCAAYPEPGRSHFEVKAEEPGEGVSSGATTAWQQPGDFHLLPRELARELFFHDCPPDVQEWALARLRRQARKPLREKTPLARWPDVPRTLIITTEDRCIPLESARRTAARLFGEEPIELPGGHCPPLSRPALLAETLIAALPAHTGRGDFAGPVRSTGKDGEYDEHLQ
jgi:pimeloyl-ACP methyl ester carboxylesterase